MKVNYSPFALVLVSSLVWTFFDVFWYYIASENLSTALLGSLGIFIEKLFFLTLIFFVAGLIGKGGKKKSETK